MNGITNLMLSFKWLIEENISGFRREHYIIAAVMASPWITLVTLAPTQLSSTTVSMIAMLAYCIGAALLFVYGTFIWPRHAR